jgi:MFS transporter, PAT family, beta-lactamase induction signal transducer AmpG
VATPAEPPRTTRGAAEDADRLSLQGSARPSVPWVLSSYFAEGFPYAVANSLVEVLFRDLGASLGAVGLTSLFHLPWNLKFVWAPWMERRASMRRWIWALEFGLAVAFLLVSALLWGLGQERWSKLGLALLSVLFGGVALLSASHDVAIDAHYIGALDETHQARYVGLRNAAYKLASILARGPLLFVIGAFDWKLAFLLVALLHVGLAVFHRAVLPAAEQLPVTEGSPQMVPKSRPPSASLGSRRDREASSIAPSFGRFGTSLLWFLVLGTTLLLLYFGLSSKIRLDSSGVISLVLVGLAILFVARRKSLLRRPNVPAALKDLLGRPGITSVLLFVVTFRLGESFLQKMKWPFLSEVVGLTKGEYGTINGTLAVLTGLLGVTVGGALISRHGLRRWFWPFIGLQNSLNLLYVGVALFPATYGAEHPWLKTLGSVVVLIDECGSGFGSALLMVYLMRLVAGEHKASEYALLTALMSFGFTFAGATSGFFAEALGYAGFFALSFALTVPMMVLAPRALGALEKARV